MLFGILVNILFLNFFFIYYNWEKKQEEEAFARAKLIAELKEIIDKYFSEIELDCAWEESSPDTLLDYYIHQDEVEKLNEK